MSKIQVDTEEIAKLAKHGKDFFMDAEAEVSLARLLYIRDKIDEFIEEAKTQIETNALSVDKNFTGMKGDKLKVEYRAFGAEYKLSIEHDPAKLPQEYVTKRTSYGVNAKSVKAYEEAHGEVPTGIERVERTKKISISLMNK